MRIYLSSGNKGKIAEVQRFFPTADVITQKHFSNFNEPVENGKTFQDNSMIKAKALWEFVKNTMNENDIVMADDSGIVVPDFGKNSLGVYTKREMIAWTEKIGANEKEFWKYVVDTATQGAKAQFVSAISIIDSKGNPYIYTHVLEGILTNPRGENGFAFDTIFEYQGRTLAEMTPDEKQEVSPRIKALMQVVEKFA